jgi:hypothetical protein
MRRTICHEVKELGWPIRLIQNGVDRFTVEYGKQIDAGLTYGEAAAKYGQAIMHALACEGKLDNRERGEK